MPSSVVFYTQNNGVQTRRRIHGGCEITSLIIYKNAMLYKPSSRTCKRTRRSDDVHFMSTSGVPKPNHDVKILCLATVTVSGSKEDNFDTAVGKFNSTMKHSQKRWKRIDFAGVRNMVVSRTRCQYKETHQATYEVMWSERLEIL